MLEKLGENRMFILIKHKHLKDFLTACQKPFHYLSSKQSQMTHDLKTEAVFGVLRLINAEQLKVVEIYSGFRVLKVHPNETESRREPRDPPKRAPLFSLKMKRRLELHKESSWEHGDLW